MEITFFLKNHVAFKYEIYAYHKSPTIPRVGDIVIVGRDLDELEVERVVIDYMADEIHVYLTTL